MAGRLILGVEQRACLDDKVTLLPRLPASAFLRQETLLISHREPCNAKRKNGGASGLLGGATTSKQTIKERESGREAYGQGLQLFSRKQLQ